MLPEPTSQLKNEGITLPVDLIRTVAIILVIFALHAAIEPNPNLGLMLPAGVQLWWTSNVYDSISRTAVPLFIMLTGPLLLTPTKKDEPLRVFFKKRWNRIGIPVCSGVQYSSHGTLLSGVNRQRYSLSFKEYLQVLMSTFGMCTF